MKKTLVAEIVTTDAAATAKAGEEFAHSLVGGETVALTGDLGAGKTTFVQAIGKVLGVAERLTSPTFVYMHTHPIKEGPVRMLVHVDAYRIDGPGLRGIGLEEFMGAPGIVTVIEWAERARELLPEDAIEVTFSHLGGDKRRIEIRR